MSFEMFFVVKFLERGNNEVVPDFWYFNEKHECFWPPSNPQITAKQRTLVRASWPLFPARIVSAHSKSLKLFY